MGRGDRAAAAPVGPLKYPRYSVCVWYVSQVEKNIGRQGIKAVKAPTLVCPRPIVATSPKLARVQFRESMPWLRSVSGYGTVDGIGMWVTNSKSSPKPLDCPVLRACLPSMLSMVEYLSRETG